MSAFEIAVGVTSFAVFVSMAYVMATTLDLTGANFWAAAASIFGGVWFIARLMGAA